MSQTEEALCWKVGFLSRNNHVQHYMRSSCPHLFPIVLMALSTGMRKGEIVGLKWQDIDLDGERLVLHKTKNGDRRVVPLKGPILTLLKSLAAQNKYVTTEQFVFPGRRSDEPIDFRTSWNRAVQNAQLNDFRFHDLRHSAISYLGGLGYPLHMIGRIVGHRELSTTHRYSHIGLEQSAEALNRLGDMLSNDIIAP